jgi:hypothetical protein
MKMRTDRILFPVSGTIGLHWAIIAEAVRPEVQPTD